MQIANFGTADEVYKEIRRRILDLRYAPGEKLSEARLASTLKANRSPIRTALTRLQADGWVVISPQSGTYVRRLSNEEIEEVLEFRLVLETYVAGIAAARISDDELTKIRRAFDQFGTAATKDNIEAYVELDHMLHLAIYQAAGNELVKRTLLNLIDKVRWIRRCISHWPERNQQSLAEARDILKALEARRPEQAVEAMRVHIANIMTFRRQLASSAADAERVAKERASEAEALSLVAQQYPARRNSEA